MTRPAIIEYCVHLYYRLGHNAGTVFYVCFAFNLLLLLIIISLLSFYGDAKDQIPLFTEITIEDGTADGTAYSAYLSEEDACLVEPYFGFETGTDPFLTASLISNIPLSQQNDISETEKKEHIPLPESKLLPQNVNLRKIIIKPFALVKLRSSATEFIYADDKGETPSLTSLLSYYKIRKKNADNTNDVVVQIQSIIKIERLKTLLGRTDGTEEHIQEIQSLIDLDEAPCTNYAVWSNKLPNDKEVNLMERIRLTNDQEKCQLIASYYELLGSKAIVTGNPVDARNYFLKALKLVQVSLGDNLQTALVKLQLAQVQGVLDNSEDALRLYNESVIAFEEKSYSRYLNLAYVNFVNYLIQIGDHTNLVGNWERAIELMNEQQDAFSRALLRYGFAEYERLSGRHDNAYRLYTTAYEYFTLNGYSDGIAYSQLGRAEVLIAMKDYDKASIALQSSVKEFEKTNNDYGLAIAKLTVSARLNILNKKKDIAERDYVFGLNLLREKSYNKVADRINKALSP